LSAINSDGEVDRRGNVCVRRETSLPLVGTATA